MAAPGSDVELGGVTRPVAKAERFDTRLLDGWMAKHVRGFQGPLNVRRFAGGQSNPTFLLEAPTGCFVLRRKPSGVLVPGAHAIEREYRVIAALHRADYPVPRPLGLCEDADVIGTPFYVMEHIGGRIFWDARFPTVGRDERPRYFDAMNEAIARLHSLDPATLGLADFGRPGNYFERQIARWSRQYHEDPASGRADAMEKLIFWLSTNIPADNQTGLIHGDYRCDNLIFHPVEPRVVAVLDWELSTLGHPLADFTYNLAMYHMPKGGPASLDGVDLKQANIPLQNEYVQRYCDRTGRRSIEQLNFYLAFTFFRLAAIGHGVRGRLLRGNAANAEAAKAARLFEPCAELGWRFARAS